MIASHYFYKELILPFFSIIIPVYNVQKYIKRCLDSVINQSFKDIEIIIVDDCGNDDSINIAKEYANKDSRIRILKNSENRGTFHTRIEGMRQVRGQYVLFVDSDDFITPDACKEIYKTINHQNPIATKKTNNRWGGGQDLDIICFGLEFYPQEKFSFMSKDTPRSFKPNQNIWKKLIRMNGWNLCNKAFKKELITKTLDFIDTLPPIPRLNMAEDCLQTFLFAIFAKKGILINKTLYYYRRNNASSITKTKNQEKITQSLKDYQAIIDFTDKIPNLNPTLKYNKTMLKRLMCIELYIFTVKANKTFNSLSFIIAHLKSLKYDKSHRPIFQAILHILKLSILVIIKPFKILSNYFSKK